MSDKPMLSVELRSFLEGVVKLCAVHGPTYNELRALLDLTADRTVLPFTIGRCANEHCGSQAREISPYCSKCEPDL